ncbi:hypothetical protein KUM37_22360 [Streptomonospora sp. NEAU-YY374]|nr:hypothetical protein [Streptomonospora nanhaiensis]
MVGPQVHRVCGVCQMSANCRLAICPTSGLAGVHTWA